MRLKKNRLFFLDPLRNLTNYMTEFGGVNFLISNNSKVSTALSCHKDLYAQAF